MGQVFLNGDYLPLEQACVSPLDRGFTFGDGVYEVIPVYQGQLFRLHEHLARLNSSLAKIFIPEPMTESEWQEALEKLVSLNAGDNQSVYVQVTRGVSVRDHLFPDDISPTVFAMSKPLDVPDHRNGVSAITRMDNRWQRCDIKAITLLPGVLLRMQAQQEGAREAILLRDGLVTEGAASNVFICSGGTVRTPTSSNYLLPGITRDLVIGLLIGNEIDCRECAVTENELRNADEIWLTSSTQEIMPVVKLDGVMVGDGKPGPLWSTASGLYRNYKQDFCAGNRDQFN